MAEKSKRRLMMEASLAEDPADAFLRYGLAMQCLREGDAVEGRERLIALIADDPEGQVAAYQQLGQSYVESREFDDARVVLKVGSAKAAAKGDWHAQAEMDGLLAQVP